MIEFQHVKDRRRFLNNMSLARDAELNAEEQRVKQGKIPQARRPLIERLFAGLLVKSDGTTQNNH